MSETDAHSAPNLNIESGISRITVSGFKSIVDEQSIEVRPLTVLAGANSSGKSSMMQPLLLLKQTIEAPYNPGALLLYGPNVQFTRASQFLSRGRDGFTVAFGFCETHTEISPFGEWVQKESHLFLGYQQPPDKALALVSLRTNGIAVPSDVMLKQLVDALRHHAYARDTAEDSDAVAHAYFLRQLQSPIHVPASRVPSARSYPLAFGTPRSSVQHYRGVFTDYVAATLQVWQHQPHDARLQHIADALYRMGLAAHVEAEALDETQVELRVSRTLHRGDMVNVADVGSGVAQVLPVLVALAAAAPGQLVYIEEPEQRLHPRAQVALAAIVAQAARRGVRVVLETHSALLILALQTQVAEQHLTPEQVILHWFTRNDEGVTHITSSGVDGQGAFATDFPLDFDAVEMDTSHRFLEAALRDEQPPI